MVYTHLKFCYVMMCCLTIRHLNFKLHRHTFSILIFPQKENYNIILCQIIALWGMLTTWEDNCLPLKGLICWRYSKS